MDLNKLELFVVLAEYNSFTQCAKRLHISQPSLSKAIASLESQLGVELFDRTPTGISLTEAGRKLYMGVSPALADISRTMDEVRSSIHSEKRKLRLMTWNRYPIYNELLRTYRVLMSSQTGGIALETVEIDGACDAVDILRDGDVDLVMTMVDPQVGKKFHVRTLFFEPLIAIVHNSHALASHEVISATALDKQLVWINTTPKNRYGGETIKRLFLHHVVEPVYQERPWTNLDDCYSLEFTRGTNIDSLSSVKGIPKSILARYKVLHFEEPDFEAQTSLVSRLEDADLADQLADSLIELLKSPEVSREFELRIP